MHRTDVRSLESQPPQNKLKADKNATDDLRSYGIRRERRGVHAQLKSALLQNHNSADCHVDFEDVLDKGKIRHLPPGANRDKRGKGTAYDRSRSSEWKKSARTHLKNGREATFRPEIMKIPGQDMPQVKRHILSYQAAIKDVFTGKRLPPKKTLTRKDLLAKIGKLEARLNGGPKTKSTFETGPEFDLDAKPQVKPLQFEYQDTQEQPKTDPTQEQFSGLRGAEKHQVLLEIGSNRAKIANLSNGLEPYRDTAYGIYINTRRKVAKARRKTSQRSGISPKAKRNRRTKSGKISNFERTTWKKANEDLQSYTLSQGYDE